MTDPAPTVTAVITTHDRVRLLPRAIESVLAQSFQDLELIVVDDASSDETPAVARAWVERDRRVRYLRNEPNAGVHASRNRAIREARGVFVATLDDDDLWLPDKIALQLPHLERYPVVGCLHAYDVRPAADDPRPPRAVERDLESFFFDNRGFSPSTIIARREHLLAVGGYDDRLAVAEGIDIVAQLASRFGGCAYVDRVLIVHDTTHGEPRLSKPALDKKIRGMQAELDKNRALRSPANVRMSEARIELMRMQHARGAIGKARHLAHALGRFDAAHARRHVGLYRNELLLRRRPFTWMLAAYRRVKHR